MSWLKIDDRIPFHAKIVMAGNEAVGAWMRAAAWSAGEQQNGFFPDRIANAIAPEQVWQELVDVKLLHKVDGGWEIHDFLDWNPSGQKTVLKRAARAEAGRKGGKKSGETRRAARSKGEPNSEATREAIASRLLHTKTKQNEAKTKTLEASIPKNAISPEDLKQNEAKTNPDPDPVEEPPNPRESEAGASPKKCEPPASTTELRDPALLDTFKAAWLEAGMRPKAYPHGAWREFSINWGILTPGMDSQGRHDLLRREVLRWCRETSPSDAGKPIGLFMFWANQQEGLGVAKSFIPYHQPAEIPRDLTPEENQAFIDEALAWDLSTLGVAS